MRRTHRQTATSRRLRLATGAVVIGTTLMLAACGSSAVKATGTGLTPAQQEKIQGDVVRFADCMRTHGVPNFPDPTLDPRAYKNAFANTSPAFTNAENDCGHLLAGGGLHRNPTPPPSHDQLAAEVAFARCVRGHGIQRFPDPSGGAGITHELVAAAGIDLHQPAVLRAAYACVGVTHGLITRTTVANFIAGH